MGLYEVAGPACDGEGRSLWLLRGPGLSGAGVGFTVPGVAEVCASVCELAYAAGREARSGAEMLDVAPVFDRVVAVLRRRVAENEALARELLAQGGAGAAMEMLARSMLDAVASAVIVGTMPKGRDASEEETDAAAQLVAAVDAAGRNEYERVVGLPMRALSDVGGGIGGHGAPGVSDG